MNKFPALLEKRFPDLVGSLGRCVVAAKEGKPQRISLTDLEIDLFLEFSSILNVGNNIAGLAAFCIGFAMKPGASLEDQKNALRNLGFGIIVQSGRESFFELKRIV